MKDHTELILSIQRPNFYETDEDNSYDETRREQKNRVDNASTGETSTSKDEMHSAVRQRQSHEPDGIQTGVTDIETKQDSRTELLNTPSTLLQQNVQAKDTFSESEQSNAAEHSNQESCMDDRQKMHSISAKELESSLL